METIASYAVAIIAIGILIVLHEAGHFLVARWSGMSVSKFSVGFGPPLAKFEAGGTVYQIGAIPLGGFVQIDGMSPHDGTDPKAPTSYRNRPFHQRFATILAGPVANYLIGFLLLVSFFAIYNYRSLPPIRVMEVAAGSPAEKAGIEKDDLITGTSSAAFERLDELPAAIQRTGGGPITLMVQRGDETRSVTVRPKEVSGGHYLIGIGMRADRLEENPLGVVESAKRAAEDVWRYPKLLLRALASVIRQDGASKVSGPVGMVRDLSSRVVSSFGSAIGQVARISVALGFFNLLPIPGLDGSRLLFLLYGVIRRKEVEPKVETVIHAIGIVLLLGLMVLVTIGDLLE